MLNLLRSRFGCLLVLAFQVLCLASALSAQVPGSFFGMHMSVRALRSGAWPPIPFSSLRLWDTKTSWAQLNPSRGKYEWGTLDDWLNDTQSHGVDVLYTFGHTPPWASSGARQDSCAYEPGACSPPNDLKDDGSGSDQNWKDFVTAIAKHSAGKIKYWEIWNEPINRKMWTGTIPQLVRMAKDANSIIKSIDPDAVVLTPTLAMGTPRAKSWTKEYFATGAGDYADAIAYHAYVSVPEDVVQVIEDLRNTAGKYGQDSKPLWQTEGSWGKSESVGFTDFDQQADYMIKLYTLLTSYRVAKFYWYAWANPGWGTLWSPDRGARPAAMAYEKVHGWLLGAVFKQPCRVTDDVWTCDFTKAGNISENRIVWAARQGKVNYTPPATFRVQRDLADRSTAVKGAITISSRPVLLTNQANTQR